MNVQYLAAITAILVSLTVTQTQTETDVLRELCNTWKSAYWPAKCDGHVCSWLGVGCSGERVDELCGFLSVLPAFTISLQMIINVDCVFSICVV